MKRSDEKYFINALLCSKASKTRQLDKSVYLDPLL
jgi:hypothetical protein